MFQQPRTFVEAFGHSNRTQVPAFRVIAGLAGLLSKLIPGRTHVVSHAVCAVVCFFPLAAYFSLQPGSFVGWNYVGAALWGAACYAMIYFPAIVRHRLKIAAPDLDDMFAPRASDVQLRLVRAVTIGAHPVFALSAGCVGAAAALSAALAAGYSDSGHPASIALTLLVGFLVGHSAYLIFAAVFFVMRVATASNLRLDWPSPLLTPGLKCSSDAIRLMAQLGFVLFMLLDGALIIELLYGPVRITLTHIIVAGSIGLSCVLVAGLLCQHWLAKPARSATDASIRQVSLEIAQVRSSLGHFGPASNKELERLRNLTDIHRAVSSGPNSYMDLPMVTTYAATALGVILPVVLASLLK